MNYIDRMGELKFQIKKLENEYDELRKELLNQFGPGEFRGGEDPKLYRGDAYQVKIHRVRETEVDVGLMYSMTGLGDFLKCIKPDVTKIKAILDVATQNQVLTFIEARNPTVTVEPIG